MRCVQHGSLSSPLHQSQSKMLLANRLQHLAACLALSQQPGVPFRLKYSQFNRMNQLLSLSSLKARMIHARSALMHSCTAKESADSNAGMSSTQLVGRISSLQNDKRCHHDGIHLARIAEVVATSSLSGTTSSRTSPHKRLEANRPKISCQDLEHLNTTCSTLHALLAPSVQHTRLRSLGRPSSCSRWTAQDTEAHHAVVTTRPSPPRMPCRRRCWNPSTSTHAFLTGVPR